ncbi:MAG: flotillin family protein [Armatimonadetes bacterium]|nr:flotillin family protein [Armatimonadota bacterium]
MDWAAIIIGILIVAAVAVFITITRLIQICEPNEVLIFSGTRRRLADRSIGYRIIKGGMGVRKPLIERVDKMDLTNMIIDVSASNAYSKGGVPLTVQGVANVKIAGHEPVLNNAIERFLGKTRAEVMSIAKATLEGSLRGVLATLTPEQVNEDKLLFAEKLVQEVEHDMTSLGLVVDTLKIQNVQDDVKYLDSIGRKQTAEVVRVARIAEAKAMSEAAIRSAENREREVTAQITAQVSIAKADAQKRLTDALTRRDAVVAEEQATVAAALASAKAEVGVQTARVEQVKGQLDADVVQPAKAARLAAEAAAKASAAPIIQDGKARAEVLQTLADSWVKAGKNARDVFLLQKLDKVIETITSVVAETEIEKLTMIDSSGTGATQPMKAVATLEQIKEIFGIDVVGKLKSLGEHNALPANRNDEAPFEETREILTPKSTPDS